MRDEFFYFSGGFGKGDPFLMELLSIKFGLGHAWELGHRDDVVCVSLTIEKQ